ncbi:MAG: shikimate kinase [Halanaerobiales bacterium]|nr:shikimate kinase [Halanaerobiales bacterium]
MRISMIGFMASGKTTVGKILAEKLEYEFIDLDQYIEEITQMKVQEIFKQKGEKHFRFLEKIFLKKLLRQYEELVIAPGGGIVLDKENINLLKTISIPFLLKANPTIILERIEDISKRPLLDQDNPKETIVKLLNERERYYSQFSNVIETNHKTPEQIVEEILNKLESL